MGKKPSPIAGVTPAIVHGPGGVEAQPIYLPHGGLLTIFEHENPLHADNLASRPAQIPAGLVILALPLEASQQLVRALGLAKSARVADGNGA